SYDPDGAGGQGTTTERFALDGWKVHQDFAGHRSKFIGTENFDAWADMNGGNALTIRRGFGEEADKLGGGGARRGAGAWERAGRRLGTWRTGRGRCAVC